MPTKVGRSNATSIRIGILEILQGTQGIFAQTSDLMARAVSLATIEAERNGSSVADSIHELVSTAVSALAGFRRDAASVVEGITVGVFRGTREFGPAARRTLFRVSRSIVHGMIDVKGDIHQAFRGLLRGAIRSARDLGMDESAAASAAAAYALDAAEECDPAAAAQLRSSAMDTIDGVRFVLHAGQDRKLSS